MHTIHTYVWRPIRMYGTHSHIYTHAQTACTYVGTHTHHTTHTTHATHQHTHTHYTHSIPHTHPTLHYTTLHTSSPWSPAQLRGRWQNKVKFAGQLEDRILKSPESECYPLTTIYQLHPLQVLYTLQLWPHLYPSGLVSDQPWPLSHGLEYWNGGTHCKNGKESNTQEVTSTTTHYTGSYINNTLHRLHGQEYRQHVQSKAKITVAMWNTAITA